MPFTISHAAAAFPARWLLGSTIPLGSIIVGSMSPDFEYPFRLVAAGRLGHSLPGVFTFCLPIGLACYAYFQYRLRPWLEWLAPSGHRERLMAVAPYRMASARSIGWASVGVVIGAVTHLAWDACTHRYGQVVHQVPMLQAHVATIDGLEIFAFQIAQHASSIVGLLALSIAYANWFRLAVPVAEIQRREYPKAAWATLCVVGLVPAAGGGLLAAWSTFGMVGGKAVASAVVQFAVGWIATLGALLMILGLARPPSD